MNLKEREAQACAIIDGIQDELKSISLFLHNNPELGQQEVRAVHTISRYMEQHGFDTTVGLTTCPELRTAMRSDIGIDCLHKMAFLGEYDALPGTDWEKTAKERLHFHDMQPERVAYR